MSPEPISVLQLAGKLISGMSLPTRPRETFYQYWNRLLAMKDPKLVTELLSHFESPSIEALEERFAYTKHTDDELNATYGEIWAFEIASDIPGMDSLSHPPNPEEAIWEIQMRLNSRLESCIGTSKEDGARDDLVRFYHLLGCGSEEEYKIRLNEDEERPQAEDPEDITTKLGGTSLDEGDPKMVKMNWSAVATNFPGAHPGDELGKVYLRRWGAIMRMPKQEKEQREQAKENLLSDLRQVQPEAAANITIEKMPIIAGDLRRAFGDKYQSEAEAPLGSAPPQAGAGAAQLKALDEFSEWGVASKDKLSDGDEQPVILYLHRKWSTVDDDADRDLVIKKMAEAYPGYGWSAESIDQALTMDPEELANKRPPGDDKGKGASGGKDESNPFAGVELRGKKISAFYAASASVLESEEAGTVLEFANRFCDSITGRAQLEKLEEFIAKYQAKMPLNVKASGLSKAIERELKKETIRITKKPTTKKAPAKKTSVRKTAAQKAAEAKVKRQQEVAEAFEKDLLDCPDLIELIQDEWFASGAIKVKAYLALLKGQDVDPDVVYEFVSKGLGLGEHTLEIAEAYTELEPIVPEPEPEPEPAPEPIVLTDEERQLWQAMTVQIPDDIVSAESFRTMRQNGSLEEIWKLHQLVRERAPGAAGYLIDKGLCVDYLRHELEGDEEADPVVSPASQALKLMSEVMKTMTDAQAKQIIDQIKSREESDW